MFSVVIPLYNKAHTIERTISTVLTQTFKAFEIIVVDDGSTDNSLELLNKYGFDSRLRIIEQENAGVSAARNKGVALARYDYIAFLDADDEWLPYFLEKVNEAIHKYPEAGMYGTSSWHRNYLTGEADDATITSLKGLVNEVDIFENMKQLPHTSAVVISKKIFYTIDKDGNGFPVDMKVCEDLACFHRIALSSKVIYIGMPLGIRNNNVIGQITSVTRKEQSALREKMTEAELTKDIYPIYTHFNIIYDYWKQRGKNNSHFIPYIKNFLRTRILLFTRLRAFKTLNIFLNNLNQDLFCQLNSFEKYLYYKPQLRYVSIAHIYFVKLLNKLSKVP